MDNSWTTPTFDFANFWPHLSWTSTIPKVWCRGTLRKRNPRAIDQQHPMDEEISNEREWLMSNLWTIPEQIMSKLWTRISWTGDHIVPSIPICDCRPCLLSCCSSISLYFSLVSSRCPFVRRPVVFVSDLVSHASVGLWSIHEQFMNSSWTIYEQSWIGFRGQHLARTNRTW